MIARSVLPVLIAITPFLAHAAFGAPPPLCARLRPACSPSALASTMTFPNHPLLFNREGKPKPALVSVIQALSKPSQSQPAPEPGPPPGLNKR
jgi:hypothetical protein